MLRVGFCVDIPPQSRLEYDTQMIDDYQKMQEVDCSKLSLELSKEVSIHIAKGIYSFQAFSNKVKPNTTLKM